MNTTYLFKEETTNGQKKLRIGTRDEFKSVMQMNKEIGEENRRYFIREKSLDPNQPDLLIIEVDRSEYLEWKKEQVTRSRNYRLGKQYSQLSLERTVQASSQGKLDEPALYGEDPGFEDVLAGVMLDELREELRKWKPWAVDMLDIYMKNGAEICAVMFADRYGVGESTARRYVCHFEQKIKKFLEV